MLCTSIECSDKLENCTPGTEQNCKPGTYLVSTVRHTSYCARALATLRFNSHMAKSRAPKLIFVCQQCGAQQPRWMGKCPDCGEWNSLVEENSVSPKSSTSSRGGLFRMREATPVAYSAI